MPGLSVLQTELKFKTSRSSGKGGQHVNKVETKVELIFDLRKSLLLSEIQKTILACELKNKIDSEGLLHITAQSERSQIANKQVVVKKFFEVLTHALKPKKKRIATKPSRKYKEKIREWKKRVSEKKNMRKKAVLSDGD